MSRSSTASKSLSAKAALALQSLGENLRVARERRQESLRAWAARMDVSVPTLRRMEAGDPTVGAGVYATALWLCGQVDALALIITPAADTAAHEIEVAQASRRRK
jgi:hypothetical protein